MVFRLRTGLQTAKNLDSKWKGLQSGQKPKTLEQVKPTEMPTIVYK